MDPTNFRPKTIELDRKETTNHNRQMDQLWISSVPLVEQPDGKVEMMKEKENLDQDALHWKGRTKMMTMNKRTVWKEMIRVLVRFCSSLDYAVVVHVAWTNFVRQLMNCHTLAQV